MISEKEWRHYLSNYVLGELHGSEFIADLESFAPGEEEKKWIKIWSAEELTHHRLWKKLVDKKGIKACPMDVPLKKVYDTTDEYVIHQDWIGSMVSAAVIEHLSNAAAFCLYEYADQDVRTIFKRITGDDLGHLHFDIKQIEIASKTDEGRKKIMQVHKVYLKQFLQWPMYPKASAMDLKILNYGYAIHRLAMKTIGISIPQFYFENSLKFRIKKWFYELFI